MSSHDECMLCMDATHPIVFECQEAFICKKCADDAVREALEKSASSVYTPDCPVCHEPHQEFKDALSPDTKGQIDAHNRAVLRKQSNDNKVVAAQNAALTAFVKDFSRCAPQALPLLFTHSALAMGKTITVHCVHCDMNFDTAPWSGCMIIHCPGCNGQCCSYNLLCGCHVWAKGDTNHHTSTVYQHMSMCPASWVMAIKGGSSVVGDIYNSPDALCKALHKLKVHKLLMEYMENHGLDPYELYRTFMQSEKAPDYFPRDHTDLLLRISPILEHIKDSDEIWTYSDILHNLTHCGRRGDEMPGFNSYSNDERVLLGMLMACSDSSLGLSWRDDQYKVNIDVLNEPNGKMPTSYLVRSVLNGLRNLRRITESKPTRVKVTKMMVNMMLLYGAPQPDLHEDILKFAKEDDICSIRIPWMARYCARSFSTFRDALNAWASIFMGSESAYRSPEDVIFVYVPVFKDDPDVNVYINPSGTLFCDNHDRIKPSMTLTISIDWNIAIMLAQHKKKMEFLTVQEYLGGVASMMSKRKADDQHDHEPRNKRDRREDPEGPTAGGAHELIDLSKDD